MRRATTCVSSCACIGSTSDASTRGCALILPARSARTEPSSDYDDGDGDDDGDDDDGDGDGDDDDGGGDGDGDDDPQQAV